MSRFLPRNITASLWSSSSPDDSRSADDSSFPKSAGAGKHTQRSANALSRLDALHARNAHTHLAEKNSGGAHIDGQDGACIRSCLAKAHRCVHESVHHLAGSRRIRMRSAAAALSSEEQPQTDAFPTDSVRETRPATASLLGRGPVVRLHHHASPPLRSSSIPTLELGPLGRDSLKNISSLASVER
eukprot:CAMPEP_0180349170 /NCGR_PEP_ID=MMETSP0989-20121125/5322_1 /TAXON_ID=697907 /ORGANISM="non described non described, Strain CCMP2293" /LENGTH=185 /DNA_ID=CAMNT_0022338467 /DNA_START=20 /DNA_END=573 /DNA_ORIENTATION=+